MTDKTATKLLYCGLDGTPIAKKFRITRHTPGLLNFETDNLMDVMTVLVDNHRSRTARHKITIEVQP